MKVRANKNFESIIDATIGRVRKAGEEWEVNEQRAKLLLDHKLVSIVEEPKEQVEVKPEKKQRKTKAKK